MKFKQYVRMLMGGTALAFPGLISVAHAQDMETVEVSASRITASGFAAPTPTTVVSSSDIQQNAEPNLFTTINELPSIVGSVSTQNSLSANGLGSTSNGNTGLSSFSLHNLGTNRTLTLLDNQRVVPAYVTGIADVSEMPQLLIKRVDVVTGGASASWGSDAVGGVVNFVTDKNFNGIKGNIQGGTSAYSDDDNGTVQLAAGTSLLGGKAHIEGALEFYHNDGVSTGYVTGDAPDLTHGRNNFYDSGTLSYTLNSIPGINGTKAVSGTNTYMPQYTRVVNAQTNTASQYGLITAGPLAGLAFNANGTLSPFQYGSAPAGYAPVGATGVNACVATTCVGGDRTVALTDDYNLEDPITRSVLYTRVSYNITPDIEVYSTVNLATVFTRNSPDGDQGENSFTIACGNAAGGPNYFVPAAVNAACVANNITSFKVGETFRYNPLDQHYVRSMRRYVAGADGSFDLFGKTWTFDSYFEHGESDASLYDRSGVLVAREAAAVNAVAGPNGTVICAANANGANGAPGCVPFSFIGGPQPGSVAMNYVSPDQGSGYSGAYSLTYERQEAGSVAINGTPFRDWAGDVALAMGVEYREEAYNTVADPYGAGVSAASPLSTAYPADPVLDLVDGNNWRRAQYHDGGGNYHVNEGFIETGVPLIDDATWGKADLDLAGRATGYSTAGYVSTWKVGVTWDTPLEGLRLRALQSRDVRAPNLQELFAPSTTAGLVVTDRLLPASAPGVDVQQRTYGNLNLVPEKAANTELGLVYQPDFVPGMNMSIDYWRVAIKAGISSLTGQQVVDLCQLQGNASYCPYVNFNGVLGTANPPYVYTVPFNLAQTTTDGFDIETSYQFDLQDWNIPGGFTARALASHVDKYITNTGIAGQPISEVAGTSADPLWKVDATESWRDDKMSFSLTERWFSNGVINPYGIVCGVGACPNSTAQNPTYSAMNTPGNLFLDIGGSYKITDSAEAYFKVDNVADKLPGPIAGAGDDPIGRMYRIGLRFND